MGKSTECAVYIKIHDFDCPIEELTGKIGIEPTTSWLKGDMIPNRSGGIKRKFSSWVLSSGIDPANPIDDHIESLAELIKPRYEIFKDLINKFYGEFTIVIKSHTDVNVGLVIRNEKLKFFSDLGAAIDMDIYFLNDSPNL